MTTRRAFLGNAARLAGGLAIAACAPAPTGPSGPAAGTASPAAAAAKRGGELIIGDSSNPTSFDPAFMPTVGGRRITKMIYDTLIDIDDKGEIYPVLAESWDTPDPTTYVLHLKKGVKFHDGLAFNAEAVKFHFDRHLDPKTGSFRRGELGSLDKVTVIDDSTVSLKLKAPDQAFLTSLFDRPGAILSPNAVGKDRDDVSFTPAGTGPWKVTSFEMGDHVVVDRNPDYWDKERP